MTNTQQPPRGGKFEAARVARVAAVQALFQIDHQKLSSQTVINEFIQHHFTTHHYPLKPNLELFRSIVEKSSERHEDVDNILEASLSDEWTGDRLEGVLRAILRAGITELLLDLSGRPAPVIISEYVDIAKGFFQGTEPGFVNSVLDRLAKTLGHSLTPTRTS